MNRERAKELLPIIEAYANGKAIQFQRIDMTGWYDLHDENQTFEADRKYRIKPEPREFWVVVEGGGVKYGITEEELSKWTPPGEIIKVREVIE